MWNIFGICVQLGGTGNLEGVGVTGGDKDGTVNLMKGFVGR